MVPFASWAIRAYPRTIAMMAEHPGITLAILAAVERDSQRAKEEGRPGYQVGSLKFDSQTPVLGKLLGGMLAGGQGDLRVNILGALSPFSGELFAGADDSAEEQTPYQKVKGLVGKTGFSFNPFLVGLAYALDWDYIRPGAMSRTAGIEQAIGSMCQTPFGGYLQGVAPKVGDLFDEGYRTAMLACIDGASGCAGPASELFAWMTADMVAPDPKGAPILYVQGLADTIMPPNEEAACNLDRMKTLGVTVQACVDGPAAHTSVVPRNVAFAVAWGEAKLDGKPAPGCSDAGMPACAR